MNHHLGNFWALLNTLMSLRNKMSVSNKHIDVNAK